MEHRKRPRDTDSRQRAHLLSLSRPVPSVSELNAALHWAMPVLSSASPDLSDVTVHPCMLPGSESDDTVEVLKSHSAQQAQLLVEFGKVDAVATMHAARNTARSAATLAAFADSVPLVDVRKRLRDGVVLPPQPPTVIDVLHESLVRLACSGSPLDSALLAAVLRPAASDLATSPFGGVVAQAPFGADPSAPRRRGTSAPPTDADVAYAMLMISGSAVFDARTTLPVVRDAAAALLASGVGAYEGADFEGLCRAVRRAAGPLVAEVSVARLANYLLAAQGLVTRLRMAHNALLRPTDSSFGRYFTSPTELRRIASRLRKFLQPDDVYIDFAAGTNEFGSMLGLKCWVGVDIYPPPTAALSCAAHFRLKNWFDIASLPQDSVIGLNPPYGSAGETASRFVESALSFAPRLLALIVPDRTPKVAAIVRESNAFYSAVVAAADKESGGGDSVRHHHHGRPNAATSAGSRITDGASGSHDNVQRHPLWAKLPKPPQYVVIDWNQELTSGSCFYAPGSRARAARSGGGGYSVVDTRQQDMSGDIAGGDARRADDDRPRGLVVRPEDPPSWYLIARADQLASPFEVVPAGNTFASSQRRSLHVVAGGDGGSGSAAADTAAGGGGIHEPHPHSGQREWCRCQPTGGEAHQPDWRTCHFAVFNGCKYRHTGAFLKWNKRAR